MLYSIASINDRRIRIAIVGCGRISSNHILAIATHHEHVELVAICDSQQTRLERAQQLILEAVLDKFSSYYILEF